MMLLGLLYPLGAVLQGWIADEVGLRVDHGRRSDPARGRLRRDPGVPPRATTVTSTIRYGAGPGSVSSPP